MDDEENGYTSSEEDFTSSDEDSQIDVYKPRDQANTSSEEDSINDVYHMEAGECYKVIDMYLEGNDNVTYRDSYYTETKEDGDTGEHNKQPRKQSKNREREREEGLV